MKDRIRISTYIKPDLKLAMSKHVEASGLSESAIIKVAVAQYLKRVSK